MANTSIQTNLLALGGGAFNDDQDDYVECFRAIINNYVPGLTNFYKGLRPIVSEDVKIPCVMVQAIHPITKMTTTGKTHTFWPFDFIWVVGDGTIDLCTVKATNGAMIFRKLFSNNALNDGGASTRYKGYNGAAFGNYVAPANVNWVDSEMTDGIIGSPLLFGQTYGPKYFAAGYFRLTLETQKLI